MWTFSAVYSGWKHKANTAFPSENIYTISMFMLLKSCFRTCFRASENWNKIVDWLTPDNLSHWVDIAACGLSLFYKALSKQSSTVDKKKLKPTYILLFNCTGKEKIFNRFAPDTFSHCADKRYQIKLTVWVLEILLFQIQIKHVLIK